MPEPLLNMHQVDIEVAGKALLNHVDFSLQAGEIVRLVGPNGSGKTTLFETILGHYKNYRGEIERSFNMKEFGYLPQVAHQFPKIQIQFRDICFKNYSFYPAGLLDKYWQQASGGERKKALIAKAISETTKLLIMDEPFNHLDDKSSETVQQELLQLKAKGVSILYTDHDIKIPGAREVEIEKWKS